MIKTITEFIGSLTYSQKWKSGRHLPQIIERRSD